MTTEANDLTHIHMHKPTKQTNLTKHRKKTKEKRKMIKEKNRLEKKERKKTRKRKERRAKKEKRRKTKMKDGSCNHLLSYRPSMKEPKHSKVSPEKFHEF